MSGSKSANQGTSQDNPGSRSGSTIWKEVQKSNSGGHEKTEEIIWLFGGEKYNKVTKSTELTNDLWTYSISSKKWSLVHSGSKVNTLSADDPHRAPSVRQLSVSCGVSKEVLLVYGGLDDKGAHDDTWLFDMNTRKWLPLSEMYKKAGDAVSKSAPKARANMASWCLTNKLVIFGGENKEQELFEDTWEFSFISLNWSKARSSDNVPHNSIGRALVTYPKGRSGASTWISGSDNLYMFGGKVKSSMSKRKNTKVGYSSDLWLYQKSDDKWTFISGHKETGFAGSYGKLGKPNKNNIPGCRRNAASLVDSRGDLWLFGGEGMDESDDLKPKHLSDLWYYEKKTKMWTWIGGNKMGNQGGNFRNPGENVIDSFPGGRSNLMSWTFYNTFYVFGGNGHDSDNKDGLLNDLWQIDVHTTVQYKNTAYAGTIFMVVFMFLGLTCLVFVSFMYSRRYVKESIIKSKNPYDVEYAPLTANTEM